MVIEETPVNTPDAWSARAEREHTSWDAAGWSRQGQEERFAAVLEAIEPKDGERLLDFGCGTGAFADVLPPSIDYVGYDSAAGMVIRASREHPRCVFQSWEPHLAFDVTVCIGPFNLPCPSGKQVVWQTLRRLWDGTGRALAVSLYAGQDERCLVYGEDEVNDHLGGLSHDVTVERWRPNDILAVVRR